MAISRDNEASQQMQEKDERRKNAEQWARLCKEVEIQQKRELLEEHEREIQGAQEKTNKTSQELDALDQGLIVIDLQHDVEQSGTGETSETIVTPVRTTQTSLPENNNTATRDSAQVMTTSQAQLERIQTPVFSGSKMDYQKWYVAFTFENVILLVTFPISNSQLA